MNWFHLFIGLGVWLILSILIGLLVARFLSIGK